MEPSLPLPLSSLSHWHRTTRSFPHLNANCSAKVPESVKYAIIGSGFTGSLAAWELIKKGVAGSDILILEAREAVSGASGRNAGHVRPDAFRGFPNYADIHGPEQARKILENEKLVLDKVIEFIKLNEIDCDFNETMTLDVCLSQGFADHQAKAFSAYRAAGGDVSHIKFYQGEKAKEKTGIHQTISAYEWPAGSNHPGKLCQWILSDVIKKGARLWTHCPVVKISKHCGAPSTGFRWDSHTPRGIVAAETIIHCTNAYTAFLLPQLKSFITPEKAQAHCFVPPASFSAERTVNNTMSLRYSLHGYFSFNQLKDGRVILGGSGTRAASGWNSGILATLSSFDDTTYSEPIKESSREEFQRLTGSNSRVRHGEGLDHVWVGIIGMTPDSVPAVGPIESLPGQWICAGFNGHGMARIFTCVPGLVALMSGQSWSNTGLPECFRFCDERVNGTLKPSIKSVL